MRSDNAVINQIEELFEKNHIKGGMINDYFYQCIRKNQLHNFYIDSRVSFKGRRLLNNLIDELQEILDEN